MGKSKATDLFSNIAYGSVTETTPNTLTFSEINTGVSVHEKIAWIISKVLWYITVASIQEVRTIAEQLDMALTSNSKVDDIGQLSDPGIITLKTISSWADGTATGSELVIHPMTENLSDLPGGGLIITPKPLYIAAKGLGLAIPATVRCRIYYTIKELAADEFWELVQASRIIQ